MEKFGKNVLAFFAKPRSILPPTKRSIVPAYQKRKSVPVAADSADELEEGAIIGFTSPTMRTTGLGPD